MSAPRLAQRSGTCAQIVQLVRRVLASKMSKRIQGGLLSHTSLTYMLGALRGVSNLWELGHLRCIVQVRRRSLRPPSPPAAHRRGQRV